MFRSLEFEQVSLNYLQAFLARRATTEMQPEALPIRFADGRVLSSRGPDVP